MLTLVPLFWNLPSTEPIVVPPSFWRFVFVFFTVSPVGSVFSINSLLYADTANESVALSSYISVLAKKLNDNAFCNSSIGPFNPWPPINLNPIVTLTIIGCTPIPSGFKSNLPSS